MGGNFEAFTNRVVLSIHVQVFVKTYVSFLLHKYLKVERVDHMLKVFFTFGRNCQADLQNICALLNCQWQCKRVPLVSLNVNILLDV